MNKTEPLFRAYRDSDYEQCEELVNRAWEFDSNFQPQELADLAKCIYTKGSVLGSNYRRVVEINGVVVGFIFGRNETKPKSRKRILFGLSILWRLFRIKNIHKAERKKLINALTDHEKNRSKVVEKWKSEIVLFVVSSEFQGMGYGKKLLSGFVNDCSESGVKSIIVETNKLEASSFYEQVGFKHLSNFDSPLHEYVTKGGQACIYEYVCQ